MATFRYAVEIPPGGKGWGRQFSCSQCFLTSFAVVVVVVVNLVAAVVVNLVAAYMLM